MGAQSLGSKKRGLVDRLRQVRSSALPASAKTTTAYDSDHDSGLPPNSPPWQAEVDTDTDTPQRGRSGDMTGKSSAKARPVVRHREGRLDVEELGTGLEHHARVAGRPGWDAARRDQAKVESTDDESDSKSPPSPSPPPQRQRQRQQQQQEAGSTQPAGQAGGGNPGPSSDYEAFIREAEEDDRRRAPESKAHEPTGRGREQPLNLFYSNNWAARSEPPGKLSGIQESGSGSGSGSDGGSSGSSSSSSSSSSKGTTSAVVKNTRAPRMPPRARAHTEPYGGGGGGGGGGGMQGSRRVQFSSSTGEAGERMGGRRGSGASCTHRMKSPPRPVRRQRSMMKVIADYIRPPRD